MKTIRSIILLSIVTMLLSSCVSRTVSTSPVREGESGKVIEKKIIWFWQDEFYNP